LADPIETVSVAMCTYQGEAYLDEQLASIAAQTRLPDDLVIVDDGSTDRTLEIARSFAERAGFPVRIFRNDVNLGFIRNFERAIGLAEGDLIVLSDQDDVWMEDRLDALLGVFRSHPQAAAAFSDAELVDGRLAPLGVRLSQVVGLTGRMGRMARDGRTFEVLLRGNAVTGATLAFRSEFRGLVLPLDGEVEHDAWIALLLSAIGEVRYLPRPLIRYRQHGKNLIGAAPLSLRERLARARSDRVGGLIRRRIRDQKAVERLASVGVTGARLEALRAAASHTDVRVSLGEGWGGRLAPVTRELAAGGYHRYSRGWKSALRDLVA